MSYIKKILWCLNHKMNTVLFPYVSKIIKIFPVSKKNRIVVTNFHGKGFGDNPEYIVKQLMKKNIEAEIIWLVDKSNASKYNLPSEIKQVQYYSMRSMYYLATASVWIDNCRKDYAPDKKKDQLYIQTWHGGLGFKNVESKCIEDLSKFYLKNAKRDAQLTDLMLSNSKKTSEIYREMFWYSGNILEVGLPRNDSLLKKNNNVEEKVKKELGIDEDRHIVLYAPTFRDEINLEPYNLNMDKIVDALQKKLGGQWIGVYRMHPNIKADFKNNDNFRKCVNATEYADSSELLQAVDVLISDFSSMVFDFVLNKKLVLLYASDYEEYVKTRGIWLTYDQVPFPYAFTDEKLVEKINSLDMDKYLKELENMFNKYEMHETGLASEIVADIILEFLKTKNLEKTLNMITMKSEDKRYLLKS